MYIINYQSEINPAGSIVPITSNDINEEMRNINTRDDRALNNRFLESVYSNGHLWKEDKIIDQMKEFIHGEPKNIKSEIQTSDNESEIFIKSETKTKEDNIDSLVVTIGGGKKPKFTSKRLKEPVREAIILNDEEKNE